MTCITLPILMAPVLLASPPVDEARGALLKAYPDGLRWDNIEALPDWCGGQAFRKRGSWHTVRLEEGTALLVPLPPEAWLRVMADSVRNRKRLRAACTDGSGLALDQQDRGGPSENGALFGPMPEQAGILRLACPRDGQGPLELSLFASRRVSAGPLPPYLESIPLPAESSRLGHPGSLQTERWHSLQPRSEVILQVQGPARLAVETRMLAGQERMRDGLRLEWRWRLDDGPEQTVRIRTAVDLYGAWELKGLPERVGRLETRWIEIPSGSHHLSLKTDRPMLARIYREGPGNHLFPTLNLPSPWIPDLAGGDAQRYLAIEASAMDFRRRDGGLAALAKLDRWLQEQPVDTALLDLRRRMEPEWTRFRTLLPEGLPKAPLQPAYAWLKGVSDHPSRIIQKAGSRSELEQALSSLPIATFHPLEQEAVYTLVPSAVPSELRLLVEDPEHAPGRRLSIQIDDHPPVEVSTGPAPHLPPGHQAPTTSDLALALASWDRDWRPQPLLQGTERAPQLPPLPVVAAGMVGLPLPPGSRSIRIRPAAGDAAPWSLALQVRESRTAGTPMQGPSLLDPGAIHAFLERSSTEEGNRPWLPLWRWLQTQAETFRGSVQVDPILEATLSGRPHPEGPALMARARAFDAEGSTLQAAETWTAAFRASTGPQRAQALSGLHAALCAAGEPGLALQWTKASLLHGDPDLSNRALDLLERTFRETGSEAARITLLATATHARPTPKTLALLAEALLQDGNPRQALRVLTLMPPAAAPELWVRAGRLVRCESAVTAGLGAIPDPLQRNLWEGILDLDLGNDSSAHQAWSAAGKAALPWIESREEALRLAPVLARNPADPKLQTRWARWAENHPGPWSWRAEPWLVTTAPGSSQLHNPALGTVHQVFRAAPGNPVRLQVVGPVRLRLEAYPIHPNGPVGIRQGCLEIRGAGWKRNLPFAQNGPASSLELAGLQSDRPGEAIHCDLELDAGLHLLEVDERESEVLLQVSALRPEVPLGPLPQRSPDALRALGAPAAPPPFGNLRTASGLHLATGNRHEQVDLDELRRLVLAPLPAGPSWPPGPPPGDGRPEQETIASLCSAPDPDMKDPRSVAARLDALAAAALAFPSQQQRCLAVAEDLAARQPLARLASSALQILRTGATWTPAGATASGAGIRTLPDPDGDSVSPAVRIRQAFLADPGDRILSGQEAIVLQTYRPRAWEMTLELAPFTPSLTPRAPVAVRLDLDGKVEQVVLESDARTIRLPLAAGHHTLRIDLDSAFEGQWVRLRFPGMIPPERPPRRLKVGLPDHPVSFTTEGPLWVRADVWKNGASEPRFRYLEAGSQSWSLMPDPGEKEILCSFSFQEVIPERPTPAPRVRLLDFQPLPAGEPVPQPPPDARIACTDAYPLGGQEDGTRTLRAGGRVRRDPGAPEGTDSLQRTAELSFTHRFLDQRSGRFWSGEARVRSISDSGQSLGISGLLEEPLSLNPLIAFGQIDLIGQDGAGPAARNLKASAVDLAGGLRLSLDLGRRSAHQTEVSAFWRRIGVSEPSASLKGLDLDLWTPFRERNNWGLKASEVLHFRPWHDTRWTARGSLMASRPTGEGFTLAAATLQGGWFQRLGAFETVIEAGLTRYGQGAVQSAPCTRTHARMALAGNFWTSRQNLLDLAIDLRRDFEHRTWSGGFSVGWSFGNGRGSRDLRRKELAFPLMDGRALSGALDNGMRELP